ncbi:MAG: hypothetical protein U0V87_13825 [Acidobacteriota bacterium]
MLNDRLAGHDGALFRAAYPSDEAELRQARRDLVALRPKRPPKNSGLPGAIIEAGFSWTLTQWLCERFPRSIEIAWDDDGSAGDPFESMLERLAQPIERDSLLDDTISTQEWCERLHGDATTSLRWLCRRIASLQLSTEVADALFERLDLYCRWALTEPGFSRTELRFPPRDPYFHHGDLQRQVDLPAIVQQPLAATRRLNAEQARTLIETARLSLAVRGRETDPITYAQPETVRLYSLDHGIDIALFSLPPAQRLPLDAYVGFMAARNAVPLAYGGAWLFFDRAEVGINIFPEFRGGESAFLLAQVLRTYRQACGAERFFVDPYQFGRGNTEAIKSGAFWFYYKLGFRPVDPDLRIDAQREKKRLTSHAGARTPAKLLRRFAADQLTWSLTTTSGSQPSPHPEQVSRHAARWIADHHGGDATRARAAASEQIAAFLDVAPSGRWFQQLALSIASLPDLKQWSAKDRRAAAAVLTAKDHPAEWDYIAALQRATRLKAAWAALAPN